MAARQPRQPARDPGQRRGRVLRLLFGLLYRNRTLYWLASTLPFAGQWRHWQRVVIPRLVGPDVLEVGCGIGTLVREMAQAGYHCTALDRSPQMVAATRAELRRHRIADAQARVFCGVVQVLPFPDASFDTVVSTFPTEYIYDRAALAEIGRVLRPSGRLIVVLGAALLPTRAPLLPLVWLHDLVYGRRPAAPPPAHEAPIPEGAPQATSRIPLDAGGLTPSAERVRGPFWEVYLVLGTKSA